MRSLRASAVRTQLGIPRNTCARLAGVNVHTFALFETDPDAVGDGKRVACSIVVDELRAALERITSRVQKGR